jgi:protein-tyrosine-phosphatase
MQEREKLKVLFVCFGNAHRSPLAEALLKKLRPDWDVQSAGVQTAIPISEDVRRFLVAEGAEQYLKKAPEKLSSKQLSMFDLIVAMEPVHKDAVLVRCPQCMGRIVVWNIADPYFMRQEDALEIYEQIKQKVEALSKGI